MFIDEESVVARERDFADGGLMDGRELARGFATLRPNDLIWPYVVNNYYLGKQAPPFDYYFGIPIQQTCPGACLPNICVRPIWKTKSHRLRRACAIPMFA